MYITTASNKDHLQGILDLQQINLGSQMSNEEKLRNGFVTVHHDIESLAAMNEPHPHIIGVDEGKVISFCLVMLKETSSLVPVLCGLFSKLDTLQLDGKNVMDHRFFIMGQVCIDEKYRSQGIFYKMYDTMKKQMKNHFEYVITEIAGHNPRSLKAHHNQGFETILHYTNSQNEDWEIVAWKL